jgi:uncharacterized membrane protein
MRFSSKVAYSSLVGALYAVLTLVLAPISFGPVQLRLSEVLTVLPFLFPAAVPGLFVGCFVSNLIGSGNIFDIIFGSLATAAAGYLTSKCKSRLLAPLPPVLINAVVIGAVLAHVYTPENFLMAALAFGLQILISQALVCYGLGLPLLFFMDRHKAKIMDHLD